MRGKLLIIEGQGTDFKNAVSAAIETIDGRLEAHVKGKMSHYLYDFKMEIILDNMFSFTGYEPRNETHTSFRFQQWRFKPSGR